MAQDPATMFSVRVTFDAPEGDQVVGLLVDALNEQGPHLAKVTGVTWDDGYATVYFEPVPDDPRGGPTSIEGGAPGAEIVAALEGFSHAHSLVVPVFRALLTTTAAREAAGLSPRREMRIEVRPAPPAQQDLLSTHLSESAHPAAPPGGS
jgi:hypothetical protein